MASYQFLKSVSSNEQLKCSVQGCMHHRRKVSKYCSKHSRIQALFGHPEGKAVSPKDYLNESYDVAGFITRHQDHKAIQAGIRYFETLMKEASEGISVAGKEILWWLSDNNVTGKQCLQAVLSLWLFSLRNHKKLPDDIRLTFAFSHHLLRLSKRRYYKRSSTGKTKSAIWIKTSERKALGQHIRDTLGVLAYNASDTIEKEVRREQQLRYELGEGF